MPVIYLTEKKQLDILNEYNANKKNMEKIPLLSRNLDSGWPLLQVSLFAACDNNEFEFVLGGGKCHDFNIEAVNLALMLQKMPGKIVSDMGDNFWLWIMVKGNFHFHHQRYGIIIKRTTNGWGHIDTVQIPDDDSNTFEKALLNARYIAYSQPKHFAQNFELGYDHKIKFTKKQIEDAINQDVAVFYEGQVYIDFGSLLTKSGIGGSIYEYFKTIFQVDEFNILMQLIESDNQEKNQNHETQSPVINNEYSADFFAALNVEIAHMRAYGEYLKQTHDKGTKVIELADSLQEMITNFLKQPQRNLEEFNKFKVFFKANLHSQDSSMSEHRESWKPILLNVLIALTGIGLLAIGVNVVLASRSEKPFNINNVLFFATTQSELQRDVIERDIDSMTLIFR